MSALTKDGVTQGSKAGGSILALTIASFGVAFVWFLAFSAKDPLFLAPFREAQTAISSDWLLREPNGGMLNYQTPVLGAPWRVPLEFPLFQQTSAWVASTGISVALAGRLVSLFCWLGCLWVVCQLLPIWGFPRPWLPAAVFLTAAAPLHSAYSTACLIESMALLAGLVHIWAFWRCASGAGPLWWLAALLSGVLVALIKITTWVVPGALTGCLTLKVLWDARRSPRPVPALLLCLGLAGIGIASLASGLIWTKWSFGVRNLNPFAEALFSNDEQRSWIFGNLHDRLSPKFNFLLLAKHLLLLFGPLGVAVPWILIRALFWPAPDRRLQTAVWIPLAGYLVHAFLLFPLHLRHDYYLLGAGIFLSLATVAAIASVEAREPRLIWVRWAAPALAMSMVVGGLYHISLRRGYRDLAVDSAIRAINQVEEPGALVTFGFDWSSKIPFVVGRKALMVPDSVPSTPAVARLNSSLELNQSTLFAAAVVMSSEWSDLADVAASKLGLDPKHKFPFWEGAFLILRTNAQPAIVPNFVTVPEVVDLASRTPPSTTGAGLVFARWPGSGRPGDGFEVIVKRDRDAFWIRSDGLQLLRVRNYFQKR